ncbi:MAG: diacylglycerol kinase family protein [bacterium]|nr:hypothetical protein [Acidimicrobiia bacterium]MCY4649516.1 diacylglycerol kinase family protein [bacterium]
MADSFTDWTVLLNSRAGRGRVSPQALGDLLLDRGIRGRVESPRSAGQMADRVLEVVSSEGRVAVSGGDGTLSLTVNALCGEQWADPPGVAMLPSGSACDFIRTFGLSRHLGEAVSRLGTDQWYDIDVGSLEGEWGRRFFINVAEAGVGAAAAETAARLPGWVGAARYGLAFAARLPRFPRATVTVEGVRRTLKAEALAVIVANAQFFAWKWNIAPKANLVDNRLDVQIFTPRKSQLPVAVPKIIKGMHLKERWVQRRSWESFEVITDPPWPVEADGDMVGYTPMKVSSIPAAIRFKI